MDELILAEQTFTSILSADFGIYLMDVPAEMELKIGETYKVVFDNQEFTCTCQDCSVLMAGATAVGNGAAFGLAGNNEPFIVVSYPDGNEYTVGCLLDTGPTTHTIAIYHVAAAEVGIIQYDRSGNRMEFYGKDTLRVDTTDGGTMDFVHANLVEKTVKLDFSNDDMTVEPGAGEMFSKVSIPVPDGLTPDNIAEGVNIAGIVGTLAASSLKIATGRFTGNGGQVTVEHNLGVIPDIVLIQCRSDSATPQHMYMKTAVGFSTAFHTTGNMPTSIQIETHETTSGSNSVGSYYKGIETADTHWSCTIRCANEQSFQAGNDTVKTYSDFPYDWIAIGGLT